MTTPLSGSRKAHALRHVVAFACLATLLCMQLPTSAARAAWQGKGTNNPTLDDNSPAWSPDGTKIASAPTIAYDSIVQAGNQGFAGNLGMDFDANLPILVQALGAFDNNGDGFTGSVKVGIFNRDTSAQVGSDVTLSGSGA